MTKEELKREMREDEGDPMMRGARKRKHREMVKRNAVAETKQADVLVVNPTLPLDDDTQIRCPVCGKPFGEVVSESQMARHVEACLCDRNGNDERDARLEPDADAQPDDSLDGEDALSGLSFSTVVVGRRYASGGTGALTRGLDVRISLELNNPYDPNGAR